VTVARGSSRADYGFGAELASIGLFADALAWAGRSGTPPEAVRELARQLATTYTAYDFETGRSEDRECERHSRAREGRRGAHRSHGLSYIGAAARLRRRLQAEPLVASVGLAVQVRGRIGPAGQPVPPEEARPFPNSLQAADLHRRLAALAGLEVADAVLAGTWQLVDVDALPIAAGTLILRLGGGKMSGTLACSRFEGGYELKGQVLVFNTVKPSVAACAKAPTTWLGEGFFENPVATVRSTGSELILSRGNAIYRFVRA
jgi:heat shock protein HslJ